MSAVTSHASVSPTRTKVSPMAMGAGFDPSACLASNPRARMYSSSYASTFADVWTLRRGAEVMATRAETLLDPAQWVRVERL